MGYPLKPINKKSFNCLKKDFVNLKFSSQNYEFIIKNIYITMHGGI